jgi:cystathionine beta-lyase
MDLNHILFELGENRESYYNAVSPPIIQTSNFAFNSVADMRHKIMHEFNHHVYTRGNNPSVEILRQKLAALEGAEDALVLPSGSAAIAIALIGNLQAGDHVICVNKPYSWTQKLLDKLLASYGVTTTYVDGSIAQIQAAYQANTRVLYLESPNSLTFELQDLEACAHWAKQHGITSMIDNSHCSPLYQNPASYGIDIVLHSATKYLNGHSDVVAGVICASSSMIQKLFHGPYMTIGAIISPHEANLITRGLRTLEIRLKRSDESAKYIASILEKHPKVEQVLHPLLPSFPQYALAQKQMRGNGGLFSVFFKTSSIEQMEAFCNRLEGFLMAVSWGGHESLIVPSCVFHNMPNLPNSPIPYNMVRFYIGLEDPNWLLQHIEKALEDLE